MTDVEAGKVKAEVEVTYTDEGFGQGEDAIESLPDKLSALTQSAGDVNTALTGMNQQLLSSGDGTKALIGPVEDLGKALGTTPTVVSEVSDALGESQAAIEDTGSAFEALQEPLGTSVELLQSAAPPMQLIAEHAQSMSDQVSTVQESFAQLGDSLSQSVPLLPQFAESMHEVSASFDPAAYGLNDFYENMNVFQDALANPEPFSMIRGYLGETGQTWQDFTSSIGEDNSAILENIAKTGSTTSQVLGGMSADAQSAGKTFTESADSAQAFTDQFNAMGAAASDANKTLGETSDAMAGVGSSLSESAIGEAGGLGDALSSTFSGMQDFFSGGGMMTAMMAVQMVGMAVDQAGQQIYNMAAIAEGPAAHSFGSFTGTVDALAQSAQNVGGQFAESFGQQIIPALNAMNYQLNQPNSIAGIGGDLGGATDTLMNLDNLEMSGVALMSGSPSLAWDLFKAGGEGFINQGAQLVGAQQPFQGPGPQSQANISYEQSLAQMPQTVDKQASQLQIQAAQYFQMASDPAYLAAQQNLPVALQAYQEAQTKYDSQHAPETPTQALMNYQEQQYDAQQVSNYQQQMANPPRESIADALGITQFVGGIAHDVSSYFQNSSGQQSLYGGGTRPPVTPYDNNVGGFLESFGAGTSAIFGSILGPIFGPAMQGIGALGGLFGGGGTAPTGGGCFPAGTRVLMADGSTRAIETLQIGEQVRAHDGKRQLQATITDRITFVAKQTYELTLSDGTILLTTDSHPIATTQGWKSIDPQSTAAENPGLPVTTVAVGDSICTATGSTICLISIKTHEITTVYNITVDTAHTYYANGALVHNAKLDAGGTGTEQTTLSHTFVANVTWEAQNLEKSFTAAAQWAAQNLEKSFTAAAQWASQNLEQAFTAVAQWASQGLEQAFTAVAQWASQGLEQAFTAVANWTSQNLIQPFVAVAQWAGQGLEHAFTGVANWVGQGLEHTFTGVANWVAQNLNPTFTVNPSVTMLAEGTSNWSGGPAIVGEGGSPEVVEHNGQYSLIDQATLINLPQGASVYPMKNLPSSSVAQFADGIGDGPIIPINLPLGLQGNPISSAGSAPQSINLTVMLDSQSILSAIGIPLSQNIRLSSGFRGF